MKKKAYLKQAAAELGLTEYQLRRLAKEHRIPYLLSGNRLIFDIELSQDYLRKEALENIKSTEDDTLHYGVLRKADV